MSKLITKFIHLITTPEIQIDKEIWTSLLFIFIGGFFSILSLNYTYGTYSSPGAGFLPFWLGILILFSGIFLLIKNLRHYKTEIVSLKEPIVILLTITLVPVFYNLTGIIFSLSLLIILSSLLHKKSSYKSIAVLLVCMIILVITMKVFLFPGLVL